MNEVYPTRQGGETWVLSTDPLHDTRFDPQAVITRNVDGSWKNKSSQVRMQVFTSSGYSRPDTYDREVLKSRGYMLAPNDWRNIEMTGFVKLNAASDMSDNFDWYARGGRHSGGGLECEGSSLKGGLHYDGRARWAKESWHVSYWHSQYKPATSPLLGRWIGFKVAIYNTDKGVKMESYISEDDGVTWRKVYDLFDDGSLGGDSGHCGGKDPKMPITWGGPTATFRWDSATDVDFRDLSVREIQPIAVSVPTEAPPPQVKPMPDLIWKATGSKGAASVKGNCGDADDEFCGAQAKDMARQLQVVDNPDVARGPAKMFRFEVRFGDSFKDYSDSRALLSGPGKIWSDNGDERWYRWCTYQPNDWVGSYPKWDQLADWPQISHGAGSGVEFHHEPFGGGVESGSAPIYTGADNDYLWFVLIDQKTSTVRKSFQLAPLQRGHCYEWLFHVKWSWDPNVGFIELWLDDALIIPKFTTQTMYPQTRTYPLCGLYRNQNIGGHLDQNGNSLVWPVDAKPGMLYPGGFIPRKGQLVFPRNDGTPGVQFIGGVVMGKTRQAVLDVYAMERGGSPVIQPNVSPVQTISNKSQEGLNLLISQRLRLEGILTDIEKVRAAVQTLYDDTVKLLDKGPW